MFSGILKACAKVYFKTELQVNMLSKEVIDVKDTEMGKREHVIFSVTVGGAEKKNAMPPPTFVAQTKRQAEGQIVKTVSRLPLFKNMSLFSDCERLRSFSTNTQG